MSDLTIDFALLNVIHSSSLLNTLRGYICNAKNTISICWNNLKLLW